MDKSGIRKTRRCHSNGRVIGETDWLPGYAQKITIDLAVIIEILKRLRCIAAIRNGRD